MRARSLVAGTLVTPAFSQFDIEGPPRPKEALPQQLLGPAVPHVAPVKTAMEVVSDLATKGERDDGLVIRLTRGVIVIFAVQDTTF